MCQGVSIKVGRNFWPLPKWGDGKKLGFGMKPNGGPQVRKDVLIKKLKSLPSPFLQGGNRGGIGLGKDSAIAYEVFLDQDQRARGLIWIKQESKIFVVIKSLETWRNWIEAFQGSKATLCLLSITRA
jgi:hypothetical protein